MKKTLLLLTICASALVSNAQDASNRWGVGAGLAFTDFVNPINGQYLMLERWKGAANLNVARYLGKSFDGRLNLTAGNAFYPFAQNQTANAQTLPTTYDLAQKGQMEYNNSQFWDGGLNLVYKLANGYILNENSFVSPYLFSGIGAFMANQIGNNSAGTNDGGVGSDQFNPYMPVGLGLGFNLSDRWKASAEGQYKFALGDAYSLVQSAVRLGYNFGGGAVNDEDKMASSDDEPQANENWCNYKWRVGVGPTFNSFEGPITGQNFLLDQFTTNLGLNATRYLSRFFDGRANLGFGNVWYPQERDASTNYPTNNKYATYYGGAQMLDLNLQAVLKFANGTWMKENAIFSPYVYAGPGVNWITSISGQNWDNAYANAAGKESEGVDDLNMHLGTGLGLNFRTSDKFTLQLEGGRNWNLDNSYSYNQANIRGLMALGQPTCGDMKSTPSKPKVTTTIDSDNDGIPDLTDECPYVAGKAEFFGCPDSDGDGIGDSKDKCPFEAGVASNGGCPQATPVADSDRDGVIDSEDACPDQAGPASNKGCPKTDINVGGGKTTTTTTTTTVSKSMIGNYEVFFNGCNTLSPGQISTLQNIASMLRNNPNYVVEIGGNSAAGGSSSCAQQRADQISKILRMKGVNVSNATTTSYGDSRPKYNNSKDNRADISIYSFE